MGFDLYRGWNKILDTYIDIHVDTCAHQLDSEWARERVWEGTCLFDVIANYIQEHAAYCQISSRMEIPKTPVRGYPMWQAASTRVYTESK